ncbi:MAG: V-type ATP synthase subunit E family protein [Spirochaetales bacterium]|uniref:V-type ATP synthase subunit E n=1 Tax=Candidatus Thalassospirochaeta sargassi TaxID=3119039 RepID=A0AAJ1IFZ6_9SPIO|nr:V-type ATP synthase subunit E family protein [Spirochaetales bacterium]
MAENSKLLKGIITQAEIEAAKIISKAESTAEEKFKALDSSLKRIRYETDLKLSEKLAELKKRAESTADSELRRQNLHMREKAHEDIISCFNEKIASLTGTEKYKSFLVKLIAEGAIAVNDDSPVVRCSFREELHEDSLRAAEKLVESETGRHITLSLADKQPLNGQGVVVESANGRIAYNNQITSRLRRFDNDIKMIVINALAKEQQE